MSYTAARCPMYEAESNPMPIDRAEIHSTQLSVVYPKTATVIAGPPRPIPTPRYLRVLVVTYFCFKRMSEI